MKMRNRLKKHSLKFVAIFLSIFLWVYVLNSEKVQFEKTVAIDYILPPDMMFVERPLHEVSFVIEGPRAFVRTVLERDDRLVVDLNKGNRRKLMNFSVDVNPAELSLPFNMVVERIMPRKLNIRLERKASRILPIKMVFSGELPDKLSLARAELNYPEVEIYGPRSLLSRMSEISTRPIELESLTGKDEVPVELTLGDDRLSLAGSVDLRMSYQLKAASANFELKNVPIKILSQFHKVKSVQKTVTVRLLLPEQVLKNRSNISSSVQVWADIPDDARGKTEVPLKVILPPSMILLEVVPKTIIVNVQ